MLADLRETARLTYWLWYKPFSLRRHLRAVADETDLDRDLWRPGALAGVLRNRALLRLLGQLALGGLVLLCLSSVLAEVVRSLAPTQGDRSIAEALRFFDWGRVLRSVALGVAFGVVGVVFGVALGVVCGVAYGVVFGVVGGVAFGVAGVAGVALGVALGVVGGVADGIAFGVVFGVALGVAFGVAFGVTFIAIYVLDILDAPLWYVWSLLQWLRIRTNPTYAKTAFLHSPIQYDELIRLPLPFFDRFMVACIQANPEQRDAVLSQAVNSRGQAWAARRAVVALQVADMSAVPDLNTMSAIARSIRAMIENAADTPKFRLLKPHQAGLLARFEEIAQQLNLVGGAESRYAARQQLDGADGALKDAFNTAIASDEPKFAAVAQRWQALIVRARESLAANVNAHTERLPNVFSAGTPVRAEAPAFRGRGDVFAAIQDVTANPSRSEPMLLFGQPRMGKSSVLQQLPSKLANSLSLYVGTLTVQSTAGYVSALTHAIAQCDGLRRTGLRLQPITLEQAAGEPLVRLDQWLSALPAQARVRHVLMCFDEFEKIATKVAECAISLDALDHLRDLSQRAGWTVLFCGTHELDELSAQFAGKFKNARRVKVSYLDEASARSLIEAPEPDYPSWCTPEAVDAIVTLTRCQPFLVQAVCASLVRMLNEHRPPVAGGNHPPISHPLRGGGWQAVVDGRRGRCSADDVKAVIPAVFEEYRNYFIDIEQSLSTEAHAALNEVAAGLPAPDNPRLLRQLVDRDYIEVDRAEPSGYRFQVPLLHEWWVRR